MHVPAFMSYSPGKEERALISVPKITEETAPEKMGTSTNW